MSVFCVLTMDMFSYLHEYSSPHQHESIDFFGVEIRMDHIYNNKHHIEMYFYLDFLCIHVYTTSKSIPIAAKKCTF
jgi:hypothetical protein